jgi:DNA-directed RNA polymerase subunit RPC12/RpoP
MKKFQKNDTGFTCAHCGAKVPPLGTSSRDHCNVCLHGLHVDINPGDRANTCRALLKPTGITPNRNGYTIHFTCTQCNEKINNISAKDNNFEEVLRICKTQQ